MTLSKSFEAKVEVLPEGYPDWILKLLENVVTEFGDVNMFNIVRYYEKYGATVSQETLDDIQLVLNQMNLDKINGMLKHLKGEDRLSL